jgi:hypothetical protein
VTGVPERPGGHPPPLNWAMHLGQAALLGVLRSVLAQAAGLPGPVADGGLRVETVVEVG